MMQDFQLLYTRISHDLAGISGAIYNGIELLSESPECLEDAIPVLMDSSKDLTIRLRFFRQTFGLFSEKTEDVTALYLKTFSNPIELEGTCETQLQKMLVLTLADVIIGGGTICVTQNSLTAQGKKISEKASVLKEIFKGKTEALSEQNIPARIAFLCAQKENKSIQLDVGLNKVSLSICLKD